MAIKTGNQFELHNPGAGQISNILKEPETVQKIANSLQPILAFSNCTILENCHQYSPWLFFTNI